MMNTVTSFFNNLENFLWPLILLSASIALGVGIEIFLGLKIKKIITKRKWQSGEKVLNAFRGITFIIFLGIGIFLAVKNLELSEKAGFYLTKSINVALILSATILVSRLAVAFVNSEDDKDRGEFQGTSIISNITRIIVFCIGIVLILQTLGISVTPILTALGVGGLAVALALQDTLSNLFAGIFIIASKKVKLGDMIKLQSGEEGYVTDISWRTITINESNDTVVVVPNTKLSTAIFKNYDLPYKDLVFSVQMMAGYDNDLVQIEQLATDAAKTTIQRLDSCIKTHNPVVRFHTFTESGIQFLVTFRIKQASEQGMVRHEFIKEAMKAFQENKIYISEKSVQNKNTNQA
jgi:small-conductance mechanosensitive channel